MILDSLTLSNFRNIERVDIKFSPGINFLIGENGAGKTSVLEALNLYWNGRSFRSNSLRKLIKDDSNEAVMSGRVIDSQEQISPGRVFGLSVSGGSAGKVVKFDGERVSKSSFLAQLFPVYYYSPSSVSLVSGSPSERRKLLNWFMFHVEPKFNDSYQKLKLAVSNRNRLLRSSHGFALKNNSEFDFWEDQIASQSQKLIGFVSNHLEELNEKFREYVLDKNFLPEVGSRDFSKLNIRVAKGWNDEENDLHQQLSDKREYESKTGVSSLGFHRSDLYISSEQRRAKIDSLSRGEEKSLGLLLILSMLALLKSYNKSVLILIDDLQSELDFKNAKFIVSTITRLGFQSIVTSIDNSFIIRFNELNNYKLFHVKQGNICEDN